MIARIRLLTFLTISILCGTYIYLNPLKIAAAPEDVPTFERQWGEAGSNAGQFSQASYMAYGNKDKTFVSDSAQNKIHIFYPDGSFKKSFGDDQLNNPHGISIDPTNQRVIVANTAEDSVVVFDYEGAFIREFPLETDYSEPRAIMAREASSELFVSATNCCEVDGTSQAILKYYITGVHVSTSESIFRNIADISFIFGKVYVVDSELNQVIVLDESFNELYRFGSEGNGEGQFQNPTGIFVDEDDVVYVADSGNNRIQKFNDQGEYQASWGIEGTGKSQFTSLKNVEGSKDGTVIISLEADNDARMQRFTYEGAPVALPPPQLISLYDTNGNTISSLGTWAVEKWGSAISPQQVTQWFGSWDFLANKNNVFLGLSIAKPLNQAGAMLIKADIKEHNPTKLILNTIPVSNRIENGLPIPYLEEDGLHQLEWFDQNTIVIPGTDPAYADNSSPAGANIYTYDLITNQITKIRCYIGPQTGNCGGDSDNIIFPDLYHILGMSVSGQTMYISGSTNYPNTISVPVVYRSGDSGQTWQHTSTIIDNWYRGTDILSFYDTVNDVVTENVFLTAIDGTPPGGVDQQNAFLYSNNLDGNPGEEWEQISEDQLNLGEGSPVNDTVKPILFKGTPLYAMGSYFYDKLFHVKKNMSGEYVPNEISLGDLRVSSDGSIYNALTVSKEHVYLIDNNNDVYRSTLEEPVTWEKVAQFDEDIISIYLWQEKNAIIASSRGTNASIFYVPIGEQEGIPQTGNNDTTNSTVIDVIKKIVHSVGCLMESPSKNPDLFNITREGSKVVLNFVPVSGATGYYVSYGLDKTIHQFGTQFDWSDTSGVVQYPIYDLEKDKTYSFSVRAQNKCQPGEWSQIQTVQPN